MEKNNFWLYSSLFFMVVLVSFVFHESIHLILGLAVGIPARFLTLTAVGVPKDFDLSGYERWRLYLMNVPAFWVSVITGILAFGVILKNKVLVKTKLGVCLSWIAIIYIPYLTLQMFTVIQRPVDSGQGADFASMVSFHKFTSPTLFTILIVALVITPAIYYMLSFMFEKKSPPIKFKNINIFKRIIAFSVFLIPVFLIIKIFYEYFTEGIIYRDMFEIMFFFSIPLAVSFMILIDWKYRESIHLIQRYFYPCLFVGASLYSISLLANIPFLGFLHHVAYYLSDFIIVLFVTLPQVAGVIFFYQLRKPV